MVDNSLQKLKEKRAHLGKNIGALDFLIDFYTKKNSQAKLFDNSSALKQMPHRIHLLSEEISCKKSSEEFDFLLQYADEMRKLELVETYISLIKYLCIHYHSLNNKNQKLYLLHLSNALRISKDKDIANLIIRYYPNFIREIPLPPKLKDVFFNTTFYEDYDYSMAEDKYLIYDLQDYPRKAFTALVRKQDLKNKLRENPELYGLFCNNFLSDEENYKEFFNRYLLAYGLPKISKINIKNRNILVDLEFEKQVLSKKETDRENYPLVSIIMSAYNSQDTIEYAINSLLNQTYENIEILVCDDCSSDNTYSILKKLEKTDSRMRVYKSIRNQGTYNIRNEMIKLSKGEYITFHDSDDLALPTRIEEQVNILNNNQDIVLCVTQ